MSNKKQTAVEWLHEKLAKSTQEELVGNINSYFMQAKEIEKEQTLHFGAKCCLMTTQQDDWTLEELYNETFNK